MSAPADTPRARSGMHAQVLIILSMTLFGGYGGVEQVDLAALVRDQVDDDRRADAAATVAASIATEVAATRTDVLAFRRELLAMLVPHDGDLSALPLETEEFDTRMWKHQERILGLRDQLRGLMTPNEWNAVFDELREAREEAAGE